MSKYPTHDEQGRPIVAELGRAETPEETAARKAAATARHRGNRSVFSLIFALLASFGIVAFLVLVVVRPDAGPTQQPVDYLAAADDAQPAGLGLVGRAQGDDVSLAGVVDLHVHTAPDSRPTPPTMWSAGRSAS